MPGLELVDSRHNAIRTWRGHAGEQMLQSGPIDITPDPGQGQYGLELGGEYEPIPEFPVIQRFYADAITSEKEALLPLVPKREGKHAAQSRDTVLAHLFV